MNIIRVREMETGKKNRIEINLGSFHSIFCGLAVKSPSRYGAVIIFTNPLPLDFLNLL